MATGWGSPGLPGQYFYFVNLHDESFSRLPTNKNAAEYIGNFPDPQFSVRHKD
jgi:hypothetical protein